MTLIVAEVAKDDAVVVADSLITYDYEPRDARPAAVNDRVHALKVHILHPTVCVAMAGDFDLGLRVVHAFSGAADLSLEEPAQLAQVLAGLYNGLATDALQCEFL